MVIHMKYALISGASRGIGAAIAKALAKEGYHLYLTCIHSIKALTDYAKKLEEEYHITCRVYQADMGDSKQVQAIFEEIESLDLLINNAGISYVGLLSDMTDEDWLQIINTNLNSVFYTSRQAIPLFLKKHAGHIINISSVWGCVGASTEVAYSTTKGGLNSFTKALAKELAPSQIRVNAIACGLIDTDMNHCFSEEELADVISEIPMDRMGTPEEVADFVVQLHNGPTYLTGQIIKIDGGWI